MAPQEPGSPDALRADLRHFAQLVLRLEQDGVLLDATPQLLKLLGDLRAKLFAYEIRSAGRFRRDDRQRIADDSERIVREALERARDAEREWRQRWDPGVQEDP